MNFNKQFFLNNLWFGENFRRPGQVRELWDVDQLITTALVEPNYFQVWGTDHSGKWDGNVNFGPMVLKGARFTFLKCIDGTVASPLYYENRDRARSLGMLTGPYGWLYRNKDVPGRAQAQAYWERIKTEKKQLPATIDFEWTKYLGQWSNPTYSDLQIHAEEFIRLAGYKPILYSAPGFMNPMGPIPKAILELFEAIWLAHYGVLVPQLPMGVADWDFHQFASMGDASIISPNDSGKLEVDLNYCKDLQTLFRLAGITEPPPPVEEPMPETIVEGTVSRAKLGTVPYLNIRAGAGIAFDDLGNLYPGDRVYGYIKSAVWLEFDKIIRVNDDIQMFHGFASTQYMDTRIVPVEPPIPNPVPPYPTATPLQVVISGEGYETLIVELKPKA